VKLNYCTIPPAPMRIFLSSLSIAVFLLSSCVKRPFVPVNVGREHGNPTTPWMVSHLPEKNQWALSRTKPHNIFQRIICFDYPCRKMIGRRKALMAISFEDFQKRINSLIIKLLTQNFWLHRLEKVYKKFCSRYKHLLHRYGKAAFNWTGLCR